MYRIENSILILLSSETLTNAKILNTSKIILVGQRKGILLMRSAWWQEKILAYQRIRVYALYALYAYTRIYVYVKHPNWELFI